MDDSTSMKMIVTHITQVLSQTTDNQSAFVTHERLDRDRVSLDSPRSPSSYQCTAVTYFGCVA